MSVPIDSDDSKTVDFLLQKVVEAERLVNPKFEIKVATLKGDGYLGVIHAVKITSGDDGRRVVLEVIVKTAPKNEHFRKMTEIEHVYFHETHFYDAIYPAFTKFQAQKNVPDPFASIAKCFVTSTDYLNEGLVLENLRESGYRMWERRNPMNAEHLTLILTEYGRFHATGLALKDQKPDLYGKLLEKLVDLFERFGEKPENEALYEGLFGKCVEVLDREEDAEAIRRLKKFLDNWKQFSESLRSVNMDRYTVLTHGDCWCNNMMFKYEDNQDLKSVRSMKFLDWQIMRVGSPIQDVSHIFYTAASKEILDNYKHYVNLYYDSLKSHLRKLGSDPERVYPKSVFEDHWKRFCPNGLFVSMFMIKVMMSESDEVPDLTKVEDGSLVQAFDYEPKNTGYKDRIRDIILHFVDNNFI